MANLTVTALAVQALAQSPDAFVAVDLDTNVIAWNDAAGALTGFTADQAMGGRPPHLTDTQSAALHRDLPRFDDYVGIPSVLPRRHADGHLIHVLVSGYVRIVDDAGADVGYGAFFRGHTPADLAGAVRNLHSRRLVNAVTLDDALDAMRLVCGEALGALTAHLVVDEGAGWRGQLALGAHQEVAEQLVVPAPGDLDEAIETGTVIASTLETRDGPRQVLAVPTGPREARTVLALVYEDATPEDDLHAFLPVAQDLAIAIASEGWATIRRVDAMADLAGKVEILEAIAGIANFTQMQTRPLVAHIAEHAANSLSCERGAVYLWDEDETELELVGFYAADGDPLASAGADLRGAGLEAARSVAVRTDPVLTQDTTDCDWVSGPWDHDTGAVSVYGAPLVVGDSRIGALVVAHTTANPRGFTSLCTQVGQALARQAGLAIGNARLFDAERAARHELSKKDQQRADWIAGIVHDLRSPVTAILGFARTLQHAGDLLGPEDRRAAMESIERQSLRVARMLDDLMDSASAEAGQLRLDHRDGVALRTVIADAVMVATPEDRDRLAVEVAEDLIVPGDLGQLTRVVQNLVVNALQHAPGRSLVQVSADREGDEAVIRVIDRGPGFPSDLNVFSRYSRGPAGGTGMGLFTVKRIVEIHGGTIAVTDTPDGGATVVCRLPLEA